MVTRGWGFVIALAGSVLACGKTAGDLSASNGDGTADGAAGASGSGGALPADAGLGGAGGEASRDAAPSGTGGATVYEICDSSECLCRAAQTCSPAGRCRPTRSLER